MGFPNARILIFTKAPRPGRVKTRLIPALGEQAAADLHGRLLRAVVSRAVESGLAPVECWCAPDDSDPFFHELRDQYCVDLRTQRGADLGERMFHAAQDALGRADRVLLIGADCLVLDVNHLSAALGWLAGNSSPPLEGVAKAPLQAPFTCQGEGRDGGSGGEINAIADFYPHPNPPPARGRGLLRHPPLVKGDQGGLVRQGNGHGVDVGQVPLGQVSPNPSLSKRGIGDGDSAAADAVLGPAEDGGYVLLGLRRVDESLFRGIPWGEEQVAELTRERMRALGWSWRELETLWDVDRPADLERLRAEPEWAAVSAGG